MEGNKHKIIKGPVPGTSGMNLIRAYKILQGKLKCSEEKLRIAEQREKEANQRADKAEQREKYTKKRAAKAEELANIDSGTHLPNRRAFNDALLSVLKKGILHPHENSSFALLYMDLDKFANVNTLIGHEKADEYLKLLGKVLNNNKRDTDIIARYGGDEFTAILRSDHNGPAITNETAKVLATRIKDAITNINTHPKFIKDNEAYQKTITQLSAPKNLFGASMGVLVVNKDMFKAISNRMGLTKQDINELRSLDNKCFKEGYPLNLEESHRMAEFDNKLLKISTILRDKANKGLYKAKSGGRNYVTSVNYSPSISGKKCKAPDNIQTRTETQRSNIRNIKKINQSIPYLDR